jgi:hypothetical protein
MKTPAALKAQAKYASSNKEEIKKRNLEYRRRHPEACLLRAAKNRAIKYNLSVDISLEDIVIPECCPILGLKLERKLGVGYGGQDASPSLDRIDNSLGYIKGNVWVISQKANAMKSNATKEELIKFANWVLND